MVLVVCACKGPAGSCLVSLLTEDIHYNHQTLTTVTSKLHNKAFAYVKFISDSCTELLTGVFLSRNFNSPQNQLLRER